MYLFDALVAGRTWRESLQRDPGLPEFAAHLRLSVFDVQDILAETHGSLVGADPLLPFFDAIRVRVLTIDGFAHNTMCASFPGQLTSWP